MALREELQSSGEWLFRHRSYLPLAVAALLPFAIAEVAAGRCDWRWERWYGLCCLGLCLAGLLVRCLAVGFSGWGTSGRNTRGQRADSVNTTGLYAMVRHPLYLGNYLLFLGGTLFVGVWWVALAASLLYWLYYERIMLAEEEYLRAKFGDAFREWAGRTPAFMPRLTGWKKPAMRFQPRKVILGEYHTVLGIAAWFFAADVLLVWFTEWKLRIDPLWAGLAAGSLVFYLVVRALAKFTRVFRAKRA